MIAKDWNTLREKLKQVVEIATGIIIKDEQIYLNDCGKPHSISFPSSKMIIYTFEYNGQYLKIGKGGQNSAPRVRSHHYNPKSSGSNLAKSILSDVKMNGIVNNRDIGEWIKLNTTRVDILVDARLGIFVLNLLEATLHCMYRPRYEGFETQNI